MPVPPWEPLRRVIRPRSEAKLPVTYQYYSVPKDDPVHPAPTVEALYKASRNQRVTCDVVLIKPT